MMKAVVAGGNLKVYGLAFGNESLGEDTMLKVLDQRFVISNVSPFWGSQVLSCNT
jgi:hypothetical protein